MGKYRVYIFSAITLVGFPLVGYVISYFFCETSFWDQFKSDYSIGYQLLVGLIYGLVAATICWIAINFRFMKPVRGKYVAKMRELDMSYPEIILISISAGVGEEILFRGVLQEFMGILITSVVFVAIHGYLSPTNWRISVYGVLMTMLIVGIGILFETMGITAPIVAHAVIDIVLLTLICKSPASDTMSEEFEEPEATL